MQTFLPYPDFVASAQVLDRRRLGKQRVETLQILRALELPDYGWQSHPAVRMWRGFTPALVRYGLDFARVWTEYGHGDTTAAQIAEFAPEVADLSQADLERQSSLPGWLGDERLHRSHRSQLIAKEPGFYLPLFPGTPLGLDYFWPEPSPPADVVDAAEYGSVWILRPESEQLLGRSVAAGAVGFGSSTGVPVDASVGELAVLRTLQGNPGRRPSRAVRALSEFVLAVQPGDEVAMLIGADQQLLVGRVTGSYVFDPRDSAGLLHRRSVNWERIVARSAVRRPAALQDVRPLFSVTWNSN